MTRSLGGHTYTIVYNGELYNTPELQNAAGEQRPHVLLPLGHRSAADVVCGNGGRRASIN